MSNEAIMLFILLVINTTFWIWWGRQEKSKLRSQDERQYHSSSDYISTYTSPDFPEDITVFSRDRFKKVDYDKRVKTSKANFNVGMSEAKSNEDILALLKTRLLDLLTLREHYETTHASSKNELYRESDVMSSSIDKLKKHEDESELINYCALLLEGFDKDREYNYGLREEKIYTTRYIYGSVQAIVESTIEDIENYSQGFLAKVSTQKKQILKEQKRRSL